MKHWANGNGDAYLHEDQETLGGRMQGSSSMMAGNDMALLSWEGQVLLPFLSASLPSLLLPLPWSKN